MDTSGGKGLRKQIEVEIECPSLPNFVRIKALGEKSVIPLVDLSNDELRAIGAQWTEALVAHAAKLRRGHGKAR